MYFHSYDGSNMAILKQIRNKIVIFIALQHPKFSVYYIIYRQFVKRNCEFLYFCNEYPNEKDMFMTSQNSQNFKFSNISSIS